MSSRRITILLPWIWPDTVNGRYFVFRHKLAWEIAAVLLFKAAFLSALYLAFFANPAPRPHGAFIFASPAPPMPAEPSDR